MNLNIIHFTPFAFKDCYGYITFQHYLIIVNTQNKPIFETTSLPENKNFRTYQILFRKTGFYVFIIDLGQN